MKLNQLSSFLSERYIGFRFDKTRERREILRKIMNFVAGCKIEGDYLEFGVYKGGTFIEAIRMANRKRLNSMRFFAFDSFKGLPTPQGVDKKFDQFYGGQVSNSLDSFRKILSNSRIDLSRVEVVPGWFKDTLNAETKIKLALKSTAVVWVDCDLYESTVPVLEFIADLVNDGTILVFDDWFFYKGRPDMGERKAFTEWLEKNPRFSVTEFHKYYWHGNSFILHKN